MIRILVCGTGRNGSKSIYKLLSGCKHSASKHFCPITKKESKDAYGIGVVKYLISISPNNLDKIKSGDYDKAIILYRDSEEVIDSMVRNSDKTKEEATKYVRDYYVKAAGLTVDRSDFKQFNVDKLNTFRGQKEIFDFLEIDEEDRNYLTDCWVK